MEKASIETPKPNVGRICTIIIIIIVFVERSSTMHCYLPRVTPDRCVTFGNNTIAHAISIED
jgi:hypothetical protein